MFHRRKFLISSLKTFGFATLAPTFLEQALAAAAAPHMKRHFFVVIEIANAMDCTLGLDPMTNQLTQTLPSDLYLDYGARDIVRSGSLSLGPSALPLKDFASEMVIVNGIQMRVDQGHNTSYITSGSMGGDAAHVAAQYGFNQRSLGRLPYDVVANKDLEIGNNEISIGQFGSSRNNSSSGSDFASKIAQNYKGQMWGDLAKARVDIGRSQGAFDKELGNLKGRYSSDDNGRDYPGVELVAMFRTELSRSGAISLEHDLDSHTNYKNNHKTEQKNAWSDVAKVFKLFKEVPYEDGSLFDATTFMVVTEFSRTPFLNSSGDGKDHNILTNSILFAGRNVKGGVTAGRSHVYSEAYKRKNGFASITGSNGRRADHVGLPVDFRDGAIVTTMAEADRRGLDNVSNIYPEHVIATAFDLLGINPQTLPYLQRYRAIPNVKKG